MAFRLGDLIIESVLRDGFESVRRDPSLIDDIFEDFNNLGPLMNAKYGDAEKSRIKEFFTTKEISIVRSFAQVKDNLPALAIQLLDNPENIRYAHLDDFEDDIQENLTDPAKIQALIVLDAILINGHDSSVGILEIDDSIDLSSPEIHPNLLLEDVDGNEFVIRGIDDTIGQKKIIIDPNSDVNIVGPALIKSSIDFEQHELRGNVEDMKILLSMHTEEPLLTIYLYIIVKYFLNARKKDLIDRGFQLSTYSGSDFTRNLDYNEPVFTRYLTVSGIVQNAWDSDKVTPIDVVEVDTTDLC